MRSTTQITDQELINHYLSGNEACFESLVRRHKRKVYTCIYLIVNDRYIAEDLFQETFIKVVQKIKNDHYNDEGKFLPWILRIARNLAIDYFRKTRRKPTITSEDGEEDIFRLIDNGERNKEEEIINSQSNRSIRDLIHRLPEEQKEVLVLRHYADLSFKEIADLTQVSINTALGRMRYALNNMRKMIAEHHINLR